VRASARRPVSALMRLDLPTLERPAKAVSILPWGGRPPVGPAAQKNSAPPAKSFLPASAWGSGAASVMGPLSGVARDRSRAFAETSPSLDAGNPAFTPIQPCPARSGGLAHHMTIVHAIATPFPSHFQRLDRPCHVCPV